MLLAATSAVDVGVFALGAILILGGALSVVLQRNPVHAALSLVVTLFGIAVLFVQQQADFLAVVQVIVYAGAIVVLFLFVIMLIGVDSDEELGDEPLKGQRVAAVVIGVLSLAGLLVLTRVVDWTTGASSVAGPLDDGLSNVETLGRAIFTRYLLPFEITSVLLVIAVVGAVVLARRPGTAELDAEGRARRPQDEVGTP